MCWIDNRHSLITPQLHGRGLTRGGGRDNTVKNLPLVGLHFCSRLQEKNITFEDGVRMCKQSFRGAGCLRSFRRGVFGLHVACSATCFLVINAQRVFISRVHAVWDFHASAKINPPSELRSCYYGQEWNQGTRTSSKQ